MPKNKTLITVIALILLGLASRFFFLIDGFPEIPNFTAIGAVALFGAYYLGKNKSILIPIIALWVSDIVLNNMVYSQYFESFSLIGDPWVYGGFIATIAIGWFFLKKLTVKNVVVASLIGAFVFFIITNFSVWMSGTLYPKTGEGLLACYVKGIPFFRNAFLGNLVYSGVLFGLFEFVINREKKIELA